MESLASELLKNPGDKNTSEVTREVVDTLPLIVRQMAKITPESIRSRYKTSEMTCHWNGQRSRRIF